MPDSHFPFSIDLTHERRNRSVSRYFGEILYILKSHISELLYILSLGLKWHSVHVGDLDHNLLRVEACLLYDFFPLNENTLSSLQILLFTAFEKSLSKRILIGIVRLPR